MKFLLLSSGECSILHYNVVGPLSAELYVKSMGEIDLLNFYSFAEETYAKIKHT